MQLAELFALTEWIRLEIDEAGIVELYEQLQAKLQQNAQANQPQQPFEEEKSNLIKGLASVRLQTLTNEQVRFLGCIRIGQHVGSTGVGAVEEVLVRNPLDLATVATRLQETAESVRKGIDRSKSLAEDLEDCVVVDEALANDILIRVKFAGDAAIKDVVDLKEWSDVWHGIVRGITMAHGQSPSDIRVIGASQGSLLFDLAGPESFAITTTGIVYAALKVAERVVEIRKKVEEVKSLKLGNKKIATELEAEAQQVEEGGAEEVTAEFTAKLKLDPGSVGDVTTALNRSIKDLIRFLRQGGEVDCVLPELTEDESDTENVERQKLRETLHQIRELEARMRQLGPGPSDVVGDEQ